MNGGVLIGHRTSPAPARLGGGVALPPRAAPQFNFASSMQLSPADRTRLAARVQALLAPQRVSRRDLEAAIDRVASRVEAPNVEPPARTRVVVVRADSMPDLASRLRAALPHGLRAVTFGSALEGRHSVVCCEVPAAAVADLDAAARKLGLHCWVMT